MTIYPLPIDGITKLYLIRSFLYNLCKINDSFPAMLQAKKKPRYVMLHLSVCSLPFATSCNTFLDE